MQITYQKNDGSIMQRYRKTMIPYKIGDTTSMGWKVLNIEYEYKDNYYSELEYNKLIHESKEKLLKHTHAKEQYLEDIKKIVYYFIAAIIINLLKKLLGI